MKVAEKMNDENFNKEREAFPLIDLFKLLISQCL